MKKTNERSYCGPELKGIMKPVNTEACTLPFTRKTILAFMSRVNASWDPVTAKDNPTLSDVANKFTKKVKRFELRREVHSNVQ